MLSKRSTGYFSLILATFFWGFQPLCLKPLVVVMSPIVLNIFRFGTIFCCLFCLLLYKKENIFPSKKIFILLMLLGFLHVILNSVFSFMGLQYSSVTNSALFHAITPAFVVILSFLLLKERFAFLQVLGLILSIIGAILLLMKGNINILLELTFNKGDLYFLFSQLAWAFYILLSAKILKEISVSIMLMWSAFWGTIYITIYAYSIDILFMPHLTNFEIGLLFYSVFFSGMFSMVLWNLGVQIIGSSFASIFLNIIPLVGVLGAILLLKEEIILSQIVGGLCILLGIFIITQYHLLKYFYNKFLKHTS